MLVSIGKKNYKLRVRSSPLPVTISYCSIEERSTHAHQDTDFVIPLSFLEEIYIFMLTRFFYL